MMKRQVTIVTALLILVALSSTSNMLAEAQQLGPEDCWDACATGCVQRDAMRTQMLRSVRPSRRRKGKRDRCLNFMFTKIDPCCNQ